MVGVIIKNGPKPWQILQQENGYARVPLSGEYTPREEDAKNPMVYISVVKEETCEPVIWWTKCKTSDGVWSVTLDIPTGGLYSIYTCVNAFEEWNEWATRGDIIPHIGVGDLYVIAGQSNSAGFGKDFIYDPPELGIHLYKNSKEWTLATHPMQDSTGACGNANFEVGNTGHSLYLSFAKYLKRDLNYPIGLIQTSKGGSGLNEWDTDDEGLLYTNMMERIAECGGKIKAMIWYQGCTEADSDHSTVYFDKFSKIRKRMEGELGYDVPVVLFQLAYSGGAPYDAEHDRGWGIVRNAIRELAHEKNTYIVPTTDSIYSDFVHISAASNVRLGERAAKIVLTHLFDRSYMCDAPEIVKAKKHTPDSVLLSFKNVYEYLSLPKTDGKLKSIMAEDCDGIIDACEGSLYNNNTLLFKFERELKEGAVIHIGATKAFKDLVPFDYATHLPILSCYGIEIED